MVKRYYIAGTNATPDGWHEYVLASDYDALAADTARIRELEAENEQLMSLCQRWSENCTGRHGSQTQRMRAWAVEHISTSGNPEGQPK